MNVFDLLSKNWSIKESFKFSNLELLPRTDCQNVFLLYVHLYQKYYMYKGSDDYYMLFHKIQTNAIKRERIERIQVLYLAYIIYVHVPTWCKTSLYKNIH